MTEEVEHLDGRKVVRGEDGRFVKVTLDPETARAMAQSRNATKARDTTSSQLLAEAGFNDTNQAPEHLRLLSEIAASKRASSVGALRDFRKLTTPASSEAGGLQPPRQGEFCALCHQVNFSGADLTSLSDLLQDMREQDSETAAA